MTQPVLENIDDIVHTGAQRRLRVLSLARSYPNDVFPELGLWTERPTRLLADVCDIDVISPVPYCPPLPALGPLREYVRFRRIPAVSTLNGVPVSRPRFLVGPGSSTYRFEASAYSRAIRRTADTLHRNSAVDLIHAHFIYPDGAAGDDLARRWSVPLVVTEHAPWTGWLERPGVRGPALAAAARAARIIAVSRSVRDSIAAYTGDADRIRVIPNGVDPSAYPLGDRSGRVPGQILFVGLINFNKGIDVLLAAMDKLRKRNPEARLLLAGGSFYRNTRLQRERLEQLAADLNLSDYVTFLGHQPPERVARLMAESSVVVLPSRAESFGSVLIEALACGTPIVATRCGGPEDIVEHEVGRLVPTEDPSALATALAEVLDDSAAYAPEALRQFALVRFGWDAVVRQTLEVYREATEG